MLCHSAISTTAICSLPTATAPVTAVPQAVFTFAIRFEYVQAMDAMLTQVQSSDIRYVRVQEQLTEWVRR